MKKVKKLFKKFSQENPTCDIAKLTDKTKFYETLNNVPPLVSIAPSCSSVDFEKL